MKIDHIKPTVPELAVFVALWGLQLFCVDGLVALAKSYPDGDQRPIWADPLAVLLVVLVVASLYVMYHIARHCCEYGAHLNRAELGPDAPPSDKMLRSLYRLASRGKDQAEKTATAWTAAVLGVEPRALAE